jgi:ParB/RepB/Spo0J family partition protein
MSEYELKEVIMPRGRPKKEEVVEVIPFVDGLSEGSKVQNIPIKRLDFDDTELEFRVDHKVKDLIEDIGKNGQQFPVILRPYEGSRKLQIVSGFRRSRAIQALGWDTVKAIVRNDLDDDMAYRVSFLENEKRKNLTGVDKAHAIVKLRIRGKKDDEVCEIYGIGQRQLERYKKVSTFPDTLKTAISEGEIQTTHGLALMKVVDIHGDKVDLASWVKRASEEGLSVRQLTRELNKEFSKVKKPKRYFEKSKGGGFRLYPMRYDPKTTDQETKNKMLEKLKTAIELLEKS